MLLCDDAELYLFGAEDGSSIKLSVPGAGPRNRADWITGLAAAWFRIGWWICAVGEGRNQLRTIQFTRARLRQTSEPGSFCS